MRDHDPVVERSRVDQAQVAAGPVVAEPAVVVVGLSLEGEEAGSVGQEAVVAAGVGGAALV
ncbi:hypothetical protein ACFOX0_19035, partial [Micromonospora zhanjiangensis]